jgi:uncharacterized GH25 family protein
MKPTICFVLGIFLIAAKSLAADLSGTVLGSDGKPIAGASVWLVNNSVQAPSAGVRVDLPTTRSSDSGEFSFTNLPSTAGQLVAGADGFGLGLGKTVNGRVEIRLNRRTDVALTFLAADGKPAAGITVYLSLLDMPSAENGIYSGIFIAQSVRSPWNAVTDANGQCTIGGLPQGAVARFDSEDAHFALTTYHENVSLASAAQTRADPIHLVPGATVTGKVIETASGKPIAGITVVAQSSQSSSGGSAITADDGSYAIRQLQPAKYDVELNLNDDQQKTWTAAAVENLTLAGGSSKDGVDFSLIPGVILSGTTIAADDGKPVQGVAVGIYSPAHPRSGSMLQSVNSDANGAFSARVPAGDEFAYVESDTPADGFGRPSPDNQTVTIADGATGSVQFRLPRMLMSPVKGTVVDPDGNPVAGASVYVSSEQVPMFQQMSVTSNADGTFQSVPMQRNGRIEIRARIGDLGTPKPFVINRGSGAPIIVHLEKNALATITGRVVDSSNQPIANSHIMLIVRMTRFSFGQDAGMTDSQGQFKIGSLWSDPIYYVEARSDGYGQAETDQLRVDAGQTLPVHDLTLYKKDSSISGQLLDADDRPVSGQQIYVSGRKTGFNNMPTGNDGKFSCAVVSGDRLVIQYQNANGRGYGRESAQAGDQNIVIHTAPRRVVAAPPVHVDVQPQASNAPSSSDNTTATPPPGTYDPAAGITWTAWLAAATVVLAGGIITLIAHAVIAILYRKPT